MLAERVNYALDGVQVLAAQTQRLDPISFAYDQSLFKLTGLTNTAHTLQVNIAPASSLMVRSVLHSPKARLTQS